MTLSGLLSSWQFWVAVVLVGVVTHLVMSYVMPKMKGGSAS